MWIKRSVSAAIMLAMTASLTMVTAGVASAGGNAESEFVSLINKERSSRGRRTLSVRSDLVAVARRHSARMAKEGRIWHNPNLASDVDGWQTVGENVGMGPSVSSLHKAFMGSTGHRANILHRDYNQIGVGIVVDDDTIFVTEVFAERGSSTVVRRTTTTVSRSSGSVATQAPSVEQVAPPKPKPVVKQKARTVDVLLRMVGYDAETLDPATGLAAGA